MNTPLLGSSGSTSRAVGTSASGYGTGAASGATYTVNLNVGGKKTTVNTATAADGQRLADFMQPLEAAVRDAGG